MQQMLEMLVYVLEESLALSSLSLVRFVRKNIRITMLVGFTIYKILIILNSLNQSFNMYIHDHII
jgi:hypothetical protein